MFENSLFVIFDQCAASIQVQDVPEGVQDTVGPHQSHDTGASVDHRTGAVDHDDVDVAAGERPDAVESAVEWWILVRGDWDVSASPAGQSPHPSAAVSTPARGASSSSALAAKLVASSSVAQTLKLQQQSKMYGGQQQSPNIAAIMQQQASGPANALPLGRQMLNAVCRNHLTQFV